MKDSIKFSVVMLMLFVAFFCVGFWAGTSPAEDTQPVQTVYVEVAPPTTSTTIVEAEVPAVVPPPVFAPQPAPEMIPKPEIVYVETKIVVLAETFLGSWDLSPPDKSFVIMDGPDTKGDALTRCEDMGGSLYLYPNQPFPICEDVDY
jgi:hypothetical protein